MTLQLHDITKRFGSVAALTGVSFAVSAGEVHAILGENGAGKSTLLRITYGLMRPDAGSITVDQPDGGRATYRGFASPAMARATGIGMVHQHFTSVPAFSVAENIGLTANWVETGRAAERRAASVIEGLGLPIDVAARAGELSVQLRQRLEIVKALASDARVLLLDEPTALLAPREAAALLQFLRGFADRGGAVVLITHKLAEAIDVADQVTVLRRGMVVMSDGVARQTARSLATAMIGSDESPPHSGAVPPGDVLVRLDHVVLAHRATPHPLTMAVRAGEVVGIAAIEGNGQRELMRAIAGIADDNVVGGVLDVAEPVSFIPEDRTLEGLIPSMTLTENVLLGELDRTPWWLDWRRLRSRTRDMLAAYDVRAASERVAAETLSGGNQQKLVLARALGRHPRVVVAEQPTRGLDVHAAQAVHQRLRTAAREGAAVLFHSTDLDEILAHADRVVVVAAGRLVDCPRGMSRVALGDAMLGMEPA